MFLATIVSRDRKSFLDGIQDKTVYYSSGKTHIVVAASPENIPLNVQNEMHPFLYKTGFVSPVRSYQHLEYMQSDILPDAGVQNANGLDFKSDFEVNRKLMALRSQLAYVATELLGPDRFYFKLEVPVNEVGTKREYNYRLYFGELPCYYLTGDPVFDQIEAILPRRESAFIETGPLICSSYTLNLAEHRPPQWYLTEIFRDLCELEEIDMSDKILVEGPVSGELYLFYKGVINVTEDQLDEISETINGIVRSSIDSKIFPRRTPQRFIDTRQLVLMKNKQWTLGIPALKEDMNLFQEQIEISFTFERVVDLFWFLFWLMLAPTYSFIEKELQISVHQHQIDVKYYTQYYPDYLRVLTASRVRAPETLTEKAELYYTERLSAEELGAARATAPYINFYDNANHENATIVLNNHDKIKLALGRTAPVDYSLKTRLKHDYQLDSITQITGK